MLAKAGAATFLAPLALLVMLAESGAFAFPASLALLVMLAEAGALAFPAIFVPNVMFASLADAPLALDWMRRRGFRRCRSCWGCLHDGEL